jgi:hypothetical protein
MLEAKADVGVVIVSLIPCRLPVRGLDGNGLVAVGPGQLNPAIPVAVLHVRAPEQDEAVLQFLFVGDESHPWHRSVQNPCRSAS